MRNLVLVVLTILGALFTNANCKLDEKETGVEVKSSDYVVSLIRQVLNKRKKKPSKTCRKFNKKVCFKRCKICTRLAACKKCCAKCKGIKPGVQPPQCQNCDKLPNLPRQYCQPGQDCWPTKEQILAFSDSINGDQPSCLKLRKFVYSEDETSYAHTRVCRNYTGLLNNINNIFANQFRKSSELVGGDLNVCKSGSDPYNYGNPLHGNYAKPDPNCDQNPFITAAYYVNGSNYQTSCMTPYQFLNNRNYKKEWMAAFIITADGQEDIVKAINFARKHSLSVSVMSTGHELNDRNAGAGPNSLLIRTTCFRTFTFIDQPIEWNGEVWTEGYAIVGAGLTFGRNFWSDLVNSEGLYPLAAKHNREMVGGSCHSVGIVGWTLAGGKGWTSTMYGLGVDQLLHVDVVLADGTKETANFTHNRDLFHAVRGGGGGFGVVTEIKMKLHKPSCDGSMENCYTKYNTTWMGDYDGSEGQLNDIKNIFKAFYSWVKQFGHFWSSGMQLHYDGKTNTFSVSIGATYFGLENENPTSYNSFADTFKNLKTNNSDTTQTYFKWTTSQYWCEVFPDPDNTEICTEDPWTVQRWSQSIRILANSTILTEEDEGKNKLLDKMIQYWQPLCDKYPHAPCAAGYLIEAVFPFINKTSGTGVYDSGGAISTGFRKTNMQIMNLGVNSEIVDLTFEQQEDWMHNILAPAIYQFSNVSYFNEAEYTMYPGQWEERFWGKENHCALLKLKKKYDPDFLFNCRHCVGSEVGSTPNN